MKKIVNTEKNTIELNDISKNDIIIFNIGSIYQLAYLGNDPRKKIGDCKEWAFKRLNSPWGEYMFNDISRKGCILKAMKQRELYVVSYGVWTELTNKIFIDAK